MYNIIGEQKPDFFFNPKHIECAIAYIFEKEENDRVSGLHLAKQLGLITADHLEKYFIPTPFLDNK